jgi:membrane-anchored mycosin MYCP
MAKIAERSSEEFNTDEIVVATPHVAHVRRILLDDFDVETAAGNDSRELGLTLLGLPRSAIENASKRNDRSDAPDDDLSRLLHMVYRRFKDEYNGWVPTMGKNRLVRPVMGAHNIGGGGSCVPVSAAGNLKRRDDEPGRGVRVGIADTAIYPHPWLVGSYQAAPASVWGDDEPREYAGGHSTFIAGLILQRAAGATLEVRGVLDEGGLANSWDLARKLVRFANSGLDVLNLSFGCLSEGDEPPMLLATALDRLDPRVVVVAAAGNHGTSADTGRPVWPAAFEEVVSV